MYFFFSFVFFSCKAALGTVVCALQLSLWVLTRTMHEKRPCGKGGHA